MNTPTPAPAAQPAPANDNPFALLDQLLAQGVISPTEHAEQFRRTARDLVQQQRIQQRRQALANTFPAQRPTPPATETTMNTQDLLNTMQLNSRIMSEQIKALNAQNQPAAPHTVRQGSAAENAAELLNHLSNTHLGNAATSLHTLAGAAARVRSEWAQANLVAPAAAHTAPAPSNNVIDVDAVEVKPQAHGGTAPSAAPGPDGL